ncbi:MAG TPA: hypothetical protein VGC41_00065 [Kofleriaceae bacterium]
MRWLVILLVACDAGTKPAPVVVTPPPAPVVQPAVKPVVKNDPPPATSPIPPPDPWAVDPATRQAERDVITAALKRYVADPKTVADSGLVTTTWVGFEPKINPPTTLPGKLVGRTLPDLQSVANTSHHEVGFVHIYAVSVTGTKAKITLGGDIVLEAKSGQIKMCCCENEDLYELRAGVWTYTGSDMGICS